MKRILPISLIALLAPGICSLEGRGDALNAPTGAVDCHPTVTAFFESKDPFVREVVLPNIEANRKSDAELQIVTADGQPLAGVKMSAELTRHEFLFGHCDLATNSWPTALTGPPWTEVRMRLLLLPPAAQSNQTQESASVNRNS